MNESYARIHLTDVCRRLYQRGLTVSAGGNMSVSLNE
jgi:ribulose-5-phosphate 4-epimerase/fuculose-1-phosphate aldolase